MKYWAQSLFGLALTALVASLFVLGLPGCECKGDCPLEYRWYDVTCAGLPTMTLKPDSDGGYWDTNGQRIYLNDAQCVFVTIKELA